MSETMWGTEVTVGTQGEDQERVVRELAGALAVSADDFAALEQRVLRTVEMVKRERQERVSAELRASNAEATLHAQATEVEHMQSELSALRAERGQVRHRVERLLKQLDDLEL